VYGKTLVTIKDDKVVTVALVVAEEEVLAVNRIDIFPIFKRQFDCREWRMSMEFIGQVMIFEEFQDLINSLISCHRFMLLA
jgi:hypothetical protein